MLNNSIIYHAYLPSFVKKLSDIKNHIPHLKKLNVDYLWINPIYISGGKDCGYDIVDYYNIDPKYGSLEDLKDVINILSQNGIKVLMDLVINHTSYKHEWFQKSLQGIQPYKDYYIWKEKEENTWTNSWK